MSDASAWWLLLAGLLLLFFGGEALVRGAAAIARRLGISPVVVGVTLVAYLTSAPEISVSLLASTSGQDDLAAANVVGSNIFNVMFILGVCALLRPLNVAQQLVIRDVPIKIGVSILFLLFAINGSISRLEGLVFLACLALFTYHSVASSRRETAAIEREYADGIPRASTRWQRDLAFLLGGLGLLVLGGHWLVSSSVAIAQSLGVDDTIIGLTIVAAGTSMPELATSLVATLRGERDIAVGNVIGSSIFNVLGIVGLASLASDGGLELTPALVAFDLPLMVAVAVACLPLVAGDHRIPRAIGFGFLAYYAAYVTYLLLDAQSHAAVEAFSAVVIEFVAPLTVAGIAAYFFLRVRDAGSRPT